MKIWITNHCKERYVERVNEGRCTDVVDILKAISSGKDITNKVLDDAPRYILYLYEKYNEFKLTIIKNNNVIFILRKKDDVYHAITCFKDENYLSMYKNTSMSRADIYLKIRLLKSKIKKTNI